MATLKSLIEDLKLIVPLAIIGRDWTSRSPLGDLPDYRKLLGQLEGLVNSPDLDMLTASELRALKTFRIVMQQAATMQSATAKLHIEAVWRGEARQAVIKMPSGDEIVKTVSDLLQSIVVPR